MEKTVTELVVLYEAGQAEALARLVEKKEVSPSARVIPLGLDIERELAAARIPFEKGRQYRPAFSDSLQTEDQLMQQFFSDARWSQFTYRNIPLVTVFLFMFRNYLQRVWYYSHFLISIIEAHSPIGRIIVFEPKGGFVPQLAGALAPLEIRTVVDCVELIAKERGISVRLLPVSSSVPHQSAWFLVKRTLFGFVLSLWNTVVHVLRPAQYPRILVSDYWRHVGPLVQALSHAECLFLDRTEIRFIPWRDLFRYRIQFVHTGDFLSRSAKKEAAASARTLASVWEEMRVSMPPVFVWRGYAFDPLFLRAIDALTKNFERTLQEIEGAYALLERAKPELVLLRASVSGQTHFPILALVAKERGIPSLELQHGIEYFGAGSLSREHTAEHIGVYGPLIKKEFMALGYSADTIHELGSPRFDTYGTSPLKHGDQYTFLCIAPDIRPFQIYDSYAAEEYFTAVAEAARDIPEVHVVIKLRTGPAGESLLRGIIENAFQGISHSIAQRESLRELYASADAVVSCFSTAILEALICGKPVVIPALTPIDTTMTDFHFAPYRDAGALKVAYSQAELKDTLSELAADSKVRTALQEHAKSFLDRNFCFDGKAAQRSALLIRKLTRHP